MKVVFRCENDWWTINRAKDATGYATKAHPHDSRLEIISCDVVKHLNNPAFPAVFDKV